MATKTFRVHFVTTSGENRHVDVGSEDASPDMDAIRERVRKTFPRSVIGKVKLVKGGHTSHPMLEPFVQPRYETHRMPKARDGL